MGKNSYPQFGVQENPTPPHIEELKTVARQYGLAIRNPDGSHVIFSLPGQAGEISVPAHRPIKPVYIKKFVALIETLAEEE